MVERPPVHRSGNRRHADRRSRSQASRPPPFIQGWKCKVDCSADAATPEARSGKKPERACKPNPVPGPGLQRTLRSFESPAGVAIIPLGPRSPSGSSSRPGDVPREAGGTGALHLPIWPCSAWGLPCPLRCRRGGALLPHRFTLTVRSRKGTERRFLFCGTFLRVAATGCYPACCPFGVRTFLPGCPGRSRGPLGAVATLARAARIRGPSLAGTMSSFDFFRHSVSGKAP